jgi:pimeloyl-ACP methyl ester carboxylesterase
MTRLASYRLRRFRRALLCGIVRRYPALKRLLPAGTPLAVQPFRCGDERTSDLLVFLPGIGDVLDDFERNRFVEAVRASRRPTDVLVADAHAGYYFHASVLDRLREDVIEPAKTCGYETICLVGISLGGFGALLYAMENTSDVRGLMLLAPYLGEDPLIAEIGAAGSLGAWNPGNVAPNNHPRRVWSWLKRSYGTPGDERAPEIVLGYGDRDGFVRGNALLASALPRDRVFTVPGGHDWRTWETLWRAMLVRRDAETVSRS